MFDATGDKTTMPSWDELVRQHADRVYRLAYRLSGNQHDAEDLTQETFIRVFRSVQNYQPGTFEGWLHRITTNLFLDMVRRRSRIRMEALPEDYDRVPADEPNPEQIYHDSRLGPDLQAALDSLAPEFRAAVVLCDIEGLSYEEIGATLGVKLGTVRSRIHRGRQALRDYLAQPLRRLRRRRRRDRPDRSRGVREAARRATFEGANVALGCDDGPERSGRWSTRDTCSVVHSRGCPLSSPRRAMRPVGPREFGSTEHLSTEAIAAFVDGELRMTAHLRAAHHMSLCPQCSAEVDAQGQARAALRDSCPIDIPSGLLGVLSQIPHQPARDPPPATTPAKFADDPTRARRKRR